MSPVGRTRYPTREDPLARWGAGLLGGPAGARTASPGHPWWSPARVLVVLATVTAALSLLRLQHCRVNGWTTPGQFVHTCYSDVAVLRSTLGGSPGAFLGLDPAQPDGVSQPALAAYLFAGLAWLAAPFERLSDGLARLVVGAPQTGDVVVDPGPRVVLDLYAVVAVLALVVAVLAVLSLSPRRRPWDGTLLAMSPVVVLSGLVSVDLLGVALGVLALALWARGHLVLAGVVLGAAVAVRFHVVLVAVALLLVALRSRRVQEVATTVSSAAFAWAVLNLPLALLSPSAWVAPLRTWWSAEPGYGSLLLLPRLVADEGIPVPTLSGAQSAVVSLVLQLVVLVAVTVWVLSAPRAPRLPLVVLVLVLGSLLAAKTVPVQASLWLLPWLALGLPRWREHVWWWSAEALYVVAVWQYLVGLSEASRALPAGFYAVLLVGRLAVLGWLAVQAWQLGRHPREDEVLRDTDDGLDPVAGPLRGAEDRLVVEFA